MAGMLCTQVACRMLQVAWITTAPTHVGGYGMASPAPKFTKTPVPWRVSGAGCEQGIGQRHNEG